MAEILNARVQHLWLLIGYNFSFTPYPLATIHPLQMDEQDNNHANSSTVTKVRSAKND